MLFSKYLICRPLLECTVDVFNPIKKLATDNPNMLVISNKTRKKLTMLTRFTKEAVFNRFPIAFVGCDVPV